MNTDLQRQNSPYAVLGRRISLSLELTVYNGIPFPFKQLPTYYLDEYLGPILVLGWLLFLEVADRVMLSAVSCGVPSLGPAKCFYILLYQRFIIICCTRKICLVFENLNHY